MTDLHTLIARSVAAAVKNQIPSPRLGLVSSVDPVNHAVKVRLMPEDVETGWLPYAVGARSGDLRVGSPPSIGQHVKVTPIEGDAEHMIVSADVLDDVVRAPISPATGKPAQPGEWLLQAGAGGPPTEVDGRQAGSAASSGAWLHLTQLAFYAGAGDARLAIVNGSITVTIGGSEFAFTKASLAATGAKITSDQDVLAGSISLKSHKHGGVKSGSDSTGAAE